MKFGAREPEVRAGVIGLNPGYTADIMFEYQPDNEYGPSVYFQFSRGDEEKKQWYSVPDPNSPKYKDEKTGKPDKVKLKKAHENFEATMTQFLTAFYSAEEAEKILDEFPDCDGVAEYCKAMQERLPKDWNTRECTLVLGESESKGNVYLNLPRSLWANVTDQGARIIFAHESREPVLAENFVEKNKLKPAARKPSGNAPSGKEVNPEEVW